MGKIEWRKKPGRVSELTRVCDMGIYAVSSDGRFRISVSRRMVGEKGNRSYHYTYTAYDTVKRQDLKFTYGGESGQPFTCDSVSDPKKAMARCEEEV